MISPGNFNQLKIERFTSVGAFLSDSEGEEVLLPNRYLEKQDKEGEEINVFVYNDSEDRLVATREEPLILVNEFGVLVVKDITKFGAFLDWGLQKDLLLPFREQLDRVNKGDRVVVYLYLDNKTKRLVATTKFKKFISLEPKNILEGDEVEVLVYGQNEIGYNVIVNQQFAGILYKNQVFKDLLIGDKTNGFVTKKRSDGKLDIALQRSGYEHKDQFVEKILNELKLNNGVLNLHDKSNPEDIQFSLQMSKKNFKKAVGYLYKNRLIAIKSDCIELIEKP
jgi:hypothetical protein